MNVPFRAAGGVALFAAAALAAGCGKDSPKLVTVTGKVVHKSQPVTAATIWFVPDAGNEHKGEKPSCLLQLDGSFSMRTYPYGDGVPPGPYKVTFSPDLASRLGKPEYADPAKTPLRVTVPDEGLRDLTVEIK